MTSSKLNDLISDFPTHRTVTTEEVDMKLCKKSNKTAAKSCSFNDKSLMYVYPYDEHYARTKSYSSSDRKLFARKIYKETLRIMKRLEGCTKLKQDLTKGISQEEIVGLEHLIFSGNPREVSTRRKAHSQAILKAFKKGCSSDALARLSMYQTKKSAHEAQRRAKIARAASPATEACQRAVTARSA